MVPSGPTWDWPAISGASFCESVIDQASSIFGASLALLDTGGVYSVLFGCSQLGGGGAGGSGSFWITAVLFLAVIWHPTLSVPRISTAREALSVHNVRVMTDLLICGFVGILTQALG